MGRSGGMNNRVKSAQTSTIHLILKYTQLLYVTARMPCCDVLSSDSFTVTHLNVLTKQNINNVHSVA